MNTGIWLAKKSYALCKFTGLFIMGSILAHTKLVEASSYALWEDINYDSHSLLQVQLYRISGYIQSPLEQKVQ